MVRQNKILIPLGSTDGGLPSIHYALALAKRLESKLYIFQLQRRPMKEDTVNRRFEKTLVELINTGRQAGLSISHHLADSNFEEEIVRFVRNEGIDVVVFGVDDGPCARVLRGVKSKVSLPIIQVRERDHIDYL